MKKFSELILTAAAIVLLIISQSCTSNTNDEGYPITPVPFTAVKVADDFWAPRIKLNHEVTIPIAFGYCESTGRVRNFEIAGGLDTGRFQTIYPFDDSDVFKIIEGAAFSLQTFPDPELESYLDTLIWKIGLAQEEDGYLYTNRTIAEMNGGHGLHDWARGERWEKTNDLSHELYNLGHLYEAAVAHYQATGKRTLLDIALKSAELVDNDFGWDAFVSYPGHQVIEIGLVKLYGVTGDHKYLDMAKFFLDARGHREDGAEYSQSHMKVVDQTEAVGHSVRATYMYSGMADMAAILHDEGYINAITKIWEDIVYRKMYITGGIGASGGNEGFGEPYNLPNMSAYCETCASIGNIFTNHRLFLMHGESKYYDILEKTLFNSMMSGVSLSADRFFYPNPLESYGQHERSAWFGCACCPSNVARFIPAVPGYIYATAGKELYINLFVSNSAEISMGKNSVKISQLTEYPWDGNVTVTINENSGGSFALKIRIPGWARNEAIPGDLYRFADTNAEPVVIKVNGEQSEMVMEEGYAVIKRNWKEGDKIELSVPMPVRRVIADEKVTDDIGKMAIQRGPVMFCAEGPDNRDGHVLNYIVDQDAEFRTEFVPDLLNGAQIIKVNGKQAMRDLQ
ncbi:MAG: glycoside hydrolase family 127 protein, partial [Bacteroidales bacterium]|nr:glycoside hydrolase family 127 protein [Bacteroidales bacterium]